MMRQPGDGVVIALGKIAISLIASFAIVYFRFPLGTSSSG